MSSRNDATSTPRAEESLQSQDRTQPELGGSAAQRFQDYINSILNIPSPSSDTLQDQNSETKTLERTAAPLIDFDLIARDLLEQIDHDQRNNPINSDIIALQIEADSREMNPSQGPSTTGTSSPTTIMGDDSTNFFAAPPSNVLLSDQPSQASQSSSLNCPDPPRPRTRLPPPNHPNTLYPNTGHGSPIPSNLPNQPSSQPNPPSLQPNQSSLQPQSQLPHSNQPNHSPFQAPSQIPHSNQPNQIPFEPPSFPAHLNQPNTPYLPSHGHEDDLPLENPPNLPLLDFLESNPIVSFFVLKTARDPNNWHGSDIDKLFEAHSWLTAQNAAMHDEFLMHNTHHHNQAAYEQKLQFWKDWMNWDMWADVGNANQ